MSNEPDRQEHCPCCKKTTTFVFRYLIWTGTVFSCQVCGFLKTIWKKP